MKTRTLHNSLPIDNLIMPRVPPSIMNAVTELTVYCCWHRRSFLLSPHYGCWSDGVVDVLNDLSFVGMSLVTHTNHSANWNRLHVE